MFACCDNCYSKYLTPNRSLDIEVFKKTFGDEADLINDNGTPKVKMKLVYEDNENKFKEITFKLCTCICHIQGMDVIH